jgi:hypothetical protein
VTAGLLIAGFALWLATADAAPLYVDYLLALLGVWSVAAPFALDYRTVLTALYNDVVVGVIVFLAAIVSIYYRSNAGARTVAA